MFKSKILKNKKFIGAIAVVLALLTAVSGTFAWFTSKDDVVNHLETASMTNGDVRIREVWDPEDGKGLVPDTEINKDVGKR